MTTQQREAAYPEAQVTERLATELPHWSYENGWIRRKYRTEGW